MAVEATALLERTFEEVDGTRWWLHGARCRYSATHTYASQRTIQPDPCPRPAHCGGRWVQLIDLGGTP